MNNFECGCERGGDCTKTSMCALQNAVEDAVEELKAEIEILEGALNAATSDLLKVLEADDE
jgi:hypothetical protein